MREHPEWLIDRVAKTLYDKASSSEVAASYWEGEALWLQEQFREDAIAVLNALGFQNEPQTPNVWQSAYLYPAKGEI